MLGTGRAIVSIAASVLQKAGLIQYRRGTVKILDRASLEDAACECYRVIKQFEAEIKKWNAKSGREHDNNRVMAVAPRPHL